MKFYRPMQCDNAVENPLVCERSNIAQLCNLKDYLYVINTYFSHGKEIANWPKGVYFTTQKEENDGEPDDVLQNGYGLPIFSKRLVKAICDAEIEGFQFLPVTVMDYGGKSVRPYYIANCLNMFDAFDPDKSGYNKIPDDFVNPSARGKIICYRFVLIAEKIESCDVFRIPGQINAYFVSDKFVKMFRKNSFSGYSFDEVRLS